MSRRVKMVCKQEKKPRKRGWLIFFVTLAVILAVAVLINMAIIFYFSEESKEESGNRSTGVVKWLVDILYPDYNSLDWDTQMEVMRSTHHLVRKLAHFAEFALLGFLSSGLVAYLNRRKHWIKLWLEWLIPLAFGLLYAISDEVHQIFSDRGASAKDVLIDFAGVLAGVLFMRVILWVSRSCKRRRERRKCETPATS